MRLIILLLLIVTLGACDGSGSEGNYTCLCKADGVTVDKLEMHDYKNAASDKCAENKKTVQDLLYKTGNGKASLSCELEGPL